MKPAARLLRASLFVDTSAFFALTDRTDRFHHLAVRFIESNQQLLVTSNMIVHETITLIRMRLGHGLAVKVGRRLFDETVTPLIRVTEADERKAWDAFRRYRDKRFSFVDCTSFVVMKRLGMHAVLAFDDDFRRFGEFVVLPQFNQGDW